MLVAKDRDMPGQLAAERGVSAWAGRRKGLRWMPQKDVLTLGKEHHLQREKKSAGARGQSQCFVCLFSFFYYILLIFVEREIETSM